MLCTIAHASHIMLLYSKRHTFKFCVMRVMYCVLHVMYDVSLLHLISE